jgi:hypothetical protein
LVPVEARGDPLGDAGPSALIVGLVVVDDGLLLVPGVMDGPLLVLGVTGVPFTERKCQFMNIKVKVSNVQYKIYALNCEPVFSLSWI